MAITDNIFRGQDTTIQITAKDEDGVVIDLDTTTQIIVRLFDEGNNLIDKYSKTTLPGFRLLTIDTPSLGIMDIFLNAAETDVANVGATVKAEVKMRFTDTDYDDNTFDAVTIVDNIGIIRKSQTKSDL